VRQANTGVIPRRDTVQFYGWKTFSPLDEFFQVLIVFGQRKSADDQDAFCFEKEQLLLKQIEAGISLRWLIGFRKTSQLKSTQHQG
jgi:hypothetical protein